MPTDEARRQRQRQVDEARREGPEALAKALAQALEQNDRAMSLAERQRIAMDYEARATDKLAPLPPSADTMRDIADTAAVKAVEALRKELKAAGLDMADTGALAIKLNRAFSFPDSAGKILTWFFGAIVAALGAYVASALGFRIDKGGH